MSSEIPAVPSPVADGVIGHINSVARDAELIAQQRADLTGQFIVGGLRGVPVQADSHIRAFIQLLPAEPEVTRILDTDHQVGLALVQGGNATTLVSFFLVLHEFGIYTKFETLPITAV